MKASFFSERIQKTLCLLDTQKTDCFLVTPSSDIKYLTGYSANGDERFLALVLSPGHEPFIIANALYELQLTDTPITEFAYWSDGEDPYALLQKELTARHISMRQVAVNAAMPALFMLSIQQAFPDAHLHNGSRLLQGLRLYKDRAEMDSMIAATAKADAALKTCIDKGLYWVGKTEADFIAELTLEMTRLGLKNIGGIAAVGEHAAVPHHITGNTPIEMGKCLLVDFGGTYENYNTDMTRTFHFGKPSAHFREVYEVVRKANLAGEAAAKVGNQLQDVDISARSVIQEAGYGKYFNHRTGHGIGIDCHEGPSAGFGETTVIAPGMAFSCEPGIYLPGEFGVRIEDQVLIEADGTTTILHKLPKELIVID